LIPSSKSLSNKHGNISHVGPLTSLDTTFTHRKENIIGFFKLSLIPRIYFTQPLTNDRQNPQHQKQQEEKHSKVNTDKYPTKIS